jgi:hypothetical protein
LCEHCNTQVPSNLLVINADSGKSIYFKHINSQNEYIVPGLDGRHYGAVLSVNSTGQIVVSQCRHHQNPLCRKIVSPTSLHDDVFVCVDCPEFMENEDQCAICKRYGSSNRSLLKLNVSKDYAGPDNSLYRCHSCLKPDAWYIIPETSGLIGQGQNIIISHGRCKGRRMNFEDKT